MSSKLNTADNLLLFGVIGVVAFVVIGFISAIIGTILFVVKALVVVAVLAVGWRVVHAISGGGKPKELGR